MARTNINKKVLSFVALRLALRRRQIRNRERAITTKTNAGMAAKKLSEIDHYTELSHHKLVRMSPSTFNELFCAIEPHLLERYSPAALRNTPLRLRVIAALNYLSGGTHLFAQVILSG